jgi:hypothetical protein
MTGASPQKKSIARWALFMREAGTGIMHSMSGGMGERAASVRRRVSAAVPGCNSAAR